MNVEVPEDLKDKPAETAAYLRGYLAALGQSVPRYVPPTYVPNWSWPYYYTTRPWEVYCDTTKTPLKLNGITTIPI